MSKINGNSQRMAKAKWVVAVLLMVTADALAQKQQPARQVLVSIPDRQLAVLEDGRVLKVFPVAVGADDSPSPDGEFQIINRLSNPTYYHPGKVIPAGPANPLGSRWIGLNLKGYGIHGTNAPRSIGKAASHGCIRMAKRDLEQLFEMVRVGDTVVIRAEADVQTAQIFGSMETVVAQAQTVSNNAVVGQ
jgi:lipoprotein-anchoring transpeptidase ErfK/SrfK